MQRYWWFVSAFHHVLVVYTTTVDVIRQLQQGELWQIKHTQKQGCEYGDTMATEFDRLLLCGWK